MSIFSNQNAKKGEFVEGKENVLAGERLRLSYDNVWFFATDSFQEYTDQIRVIKASTKKFQNRHLSKNNINGTQLLLKKFESLKEEIPGSKVSLLTLEGVRGCEQSVLDEISKNKTVFLGTAKDEKLMYVIENGKLKEKLTGLPHSVVFESWLSLDDIIYNTLTKEWELVR